MSSPEVLIFLNSTENFSGIFRKPTKYEICPQGFTVTTRQHQFREDGDMFAEDTMMRPARDLDIAGSVDVLQQIIHQVEVQLTQGDVYRRAVESLQQVTADAGLDGQILLKAVSLEAIRLTVETLGQQATQHLEALVQGETEIAATNELDMLDQSEENADREMFAAIEAVMQPSATTSNPIANLLAKYRAKRQVEVAEEIILTREELLVRLGERVQLERENRGMSIAQLHARTFIPLYHLQALEGGHVAQLPEDIYLQGFLRRIENALSLPTGSLVEAMPTQAAPDIVPSWYQKDARAKRKSFAGLDVNPTQLYFAYAAMMAGGVCWLSNQTAPKAVVPELNYEPRAQNPMPQPAKKLSTTTPKAKAKLVSNNASKQAKPLTSQTNTPVKVGVAPPEMMR
jgi:cytoskeleton protein RodZ